MGNLYVACDFGLENGRVMLGTLHQGSLSLSEVRRFSNQPIQKSGALQWNIAELYQETLAGFRAIGSYEENISGISSSSWASDYMLFGSDGSLMTPTYHHDDSRTQGGMKHVFSKVPWETVYEETGVLCSPGNTLCQLGAEKSRRLKSASHLMPVADGFNYLLTGVPRVERSLASATQLYNPTTGRWSEKLLAALGLPPQIFPGLVPAGTMLGRLRPDLAEQTKLEDTRVVTSCSHEIAAALMGLPVAPGESFAFLRSGSFAVMGTELNAPVINEVSRDMNFTNEAGYGGNFRFYKHTIGLWILEQCRGYWKENNREMDDEMLNHVAVSAPPFESLINPADPRFLSPEDMPAKIQAFCRETDQTVPRKPGPIARCILESLALMHRKTLQEIEYLGGRKISKLYMLGGSRNSLLNHFIANALEVPVVMAPMDATAIGNIIVQALALGAITSLDEARQIVRRSFKMETIIPQANAWDAAYDRLTRLCSPVTA
jgi:rhamnulokinase